MTVLIPFVLLWTLSTAKHYQDYYRPPNVTRRAPSGIAAYRAALTLDWLAAEDYRQRELVAAIELDPQPVSKLSSTDCIDYARPTAGGVARLMLELLKNLEGDEGYLVPELLQALVRTRLLALETSLFDNEPDFDALIKTPKVMMGEPLTTFPRIVEILWMTITDPSTVKKFGWCTIQRMSLFLQSTRPSDIAKHMHNVEPIVSRARYIMEEFIQQVTPLNILKSSTPLAPAVKGRTRSVQNEQNELPVLPPSASTVQRNYKSVRVQTYKPRPMRNPVELPITFAGRALKKRHSTPPTLPLVYHSGTPQLQLKLPEEEKEEEKEYELNTGFSLSPNFFFTLTAVFYFVVQ